MIERYEVEEPTSAAFPPRELWLYDPITQGRLDVIYDQYGLVDMEATFIRLINTVEPGFDWASDYDDDHHCQHDEADYPSTPDAYVNYREFRNCASRRYRTNRVTHAWWHRVLNSPRRPDQVAGQNGIEAMRLSIDALAPLRSMRQSYEYVLGTEAESPQVHFSHEKRAEFAKRLGFFCGLLESLRDVPKEFQLVCVDDLDVNNVDDMIAITQMLAKYTKPIAPQPIILRESLDLHQAA
jgi:hypothetical protein